MGSNKSDTVVVGVVPLHLKIYLVFQIPALPLYQVTVLSSLCSWSPGDCNWTRKYTTVDDLRGHNAVCCLALLSWSSLPLVASQGAEVQSIKRFVVGDSLTPARNNGNCFRLDVQHHFRSRCNHLIASHPLRLVALSCPVTGHAHALPRRPLASPEVAWTLPCYHWYHSWRGDMQGCYQYASNKLRSLINFFTGEQNMPLSLTSGNISLYT